MAGFSLRKACRIWQVLRCAKLLQVYAQWLAPIDGSGIRRYNEGNR